MASYIAIAALSLFSVVSESTPRQCEEIRGTEYLSEEERVFFLNYCLNWIPYGNYDLAAIRACESGGNYHAVSPDWVYFGAYQFDLQTWYSVGGYGWPHLATPQEQDYRAQLLYETRGIQPWIGCFLN